ncbi:hypothetical protein DFS34DRAFT_644225 [Phlyctochytrium arcticum]|nr:hypothetical protein DFS34DRAFT_644225 [Phlyctochytrium arcticum]
MEQGHHIVMPERSSPLYDNCSVFSPEGTLMFRCSRKKIDWYLSRNLAVSQNDSNTEIRLSFQPKGSGRTQEGEEYYLENRHNICVGCGQPESLTAHHVVPYQYRKFMPEALKSHSSHDVVLLCVICHDAYERHALDLKRRLAEKHRIPLDGCGMVVHPEHKRLLSAANALQLSSHKIPPERQQALRAVIREFYGLDAGADIPETVFRSMQDLPSWTKGADYKEHGQIVEGMDNDELRAFIMHWRRHFLEHVQPSFLSQTWRIENPIS